MAPSSKPQALENKMKRMNEGIVGRLDDFFEVLKDMQENTYEIYREKICDYEYMEDDRKAAALALDIKADLKATTQNIFAIQKYARELVAQAENIRACGGWIVHYEKRS